MLDLDESQITIPPTPCRSLDSSYGLRSQSQRRSLEQVVQDLSMTVGTMETVSELSSPAPLRIPVLKLDDTAEVRTEDEGAAPVYFIDPQTLPADAEVCPHM